MGTRKADPVHSWQEIENLDTLTGLQELWLGKNKITELKVIKYLKPYIQQYIYIYPALTSQ